MGTRMKNDTSTQDLFYRGVWDKAYDAIPSYQYGQGGSKGQKCENAKRHGPKGTLGSEEAQSVGVGWNRLESVGDRLIPRGKGTVTTL